MLYRNICEKEPCFLCRHFTGRRSALAAGRSALRFRKGQSIFKEGDLIEGIYFISEGTAKIHQSWGADNEFILRFSRAGDVVGHRGQGAGNRFPVSATVLEDTTVCFITSKFLEDLYKTNHSFLYEMMHLYATELQNAEKRMRELALMPVRGRVAEALFTIREVLGTDENRFSRLPVTRVDIASHAGTTYEVVFRLLKEWSREGLISTSGKKIRIEDDQKLGSIIQCDEIASDDCQSLN